MNTTRPDWYYPLRSVASLGQTVAKRPGGLAALAARRAETLSQFWTPDSIAALMWSMAEKAIGYPGNRLRRVSILDNSIGCGRLIQFCDPEFHAVYGYDIHEESVTSLSAALKQAGFFFELEAGSMADYRPSGFDIALINPPFSIPLNSPNLLPYSTSAFGRFGAGTATRSHLYAVQQAADAAELVIALLPTSALTEIAASDELGTRLLAVLDLPGNAFEHEGATVDTVIAVIGGTPRVGGIVHGSSADPAEVLAAIPALPPSHVSPRLGGLYGGASEGPTVTRPVTNDNRVRLYRDRQKLRLAYRCGLWEAIVENAMRSHRILRSGTDKRLPRGIEFAGDGQFDVEVILSLENPLSGLDQVVDRITELGAAVEIAPGVREYLARMARRRRIEAARMGHVIYATGSDKAAFTFNDGDQLDATALKAFPVNPKVWGSAHIKAGEAAVISVAGNGMTARLSVTKGRDTWTGSVAEALELFEIKRSASQEGGWVEVAASKEQQFPAAGASARRSAMRAGVDKFLTWKFQLDDVVELHMLRGGINAHKMGLGKARQALALALLGGKANLVVVEAHLVPEIADEAALIGLDPGLYQVIDSPTQLTDLRKINIISYSRLRMKLGAGWQSKTYAKALRNRIHTCIADEGQLLANDYSAQVGALYQVSAKRRYPMSGTPAGNYPRDLWPLIVWAARDGTAAQPYGKRRPYIEPVLFKSADYAERGADVFSKFVTTEWVAATFEDDLQSGAKREVPCLSNIAEYRDYIGRFVKRRIWEEPAVAQYVSVPEPTREVINVEWNNAHLDYYLTVASEFADWWKRQREAIGEGGKRLNLVTILARINAVFRAGNFPSMMNGFASYYGPNTKALRCEEELIGNALEGRKTILFASSPDFLAGMRNRLAARGVHAVLYTGKVPVARRAKAMREEFRRGPASTLLCSMQCSQTGLNVPEATDELFYNRRWSPREEDQAEYRAIRPGQKHSVRIRKLHLPGSLDEYQAQMCAFKADSMRAGLDWGTPEFDPQDFQHWLTVLDGFCEGLAALRGVKRTDLRASLVNAQSLPLTA